MPCFNPEDFQASGLAGSGMSPGLLWTVTDKGGPAKVHNSSYLSLYFTPTYLEAWIFDIKKCTNLRQHSTKFGLSLTRVDRQGYSVTYLKATPSEIINFRSHITRIHLGVWSQGGHWQSGEQILFEDEHSFKEKKQEIILVTTDHHAFPK